jgi:hypothetical protein
MSPKQSKTPTKNSSRAKPTNLSALIRHRVHSDREYPAKVVLTQEGMLVASIMPPILRTMQQEHSDIKIEDRVPLPNDNIAPGSNIFIQRKNQSWRISSVLEEDEFQKRLQREISNRLLSEGALLINPIFLSNSQRKVEHLFTLSEKDDTPWGVPGRIKNGQTLLSRRIMNYFAKHGGSPLDQALRKGLPRIEDWGKGPILFGIYPKDDETQFTSVAIPAEEHKKLVDEWDSLLKDGTNNSSSSRSNTTVVKKPNTFIRPSRKKEKNKFAIITEAPSNFYPFPHHLSSMIEALKLPMPNQPLTEAMSTLVAWTESDHPALNERSTDFFLTILAEGSPVRPNQEIQRLWTEWHRSTNPIGQLCTLVASGEEPAAIRALVGRNAPGTDVSSSITDHLLLRWRRHILRKYEPEDDLSTLEKPEEMATIVDLRIALRHRGLRVADVWLDRLFLAVGTARDLNLPLVFAGDPKVTKSILENVLFPAIDGAKHKYVTLPKKRSQLLGRISRQKDTFVLSPFARAIRKASRFRKYAPHGYWSPYFVVINKPGRHANSNVLHTILQQASGEDGVMLYTEDDNLRWLQEYKDLQTRESLDVTQSERRDTLEAFFESTAIGNRLPEKANRLLSSHNLSVIVCLDTKGKPVDLEILQHAMVMFTPDIDITDLQESAARRAKDLPKVLLPDFNIDDRGTWNRYPKSREKILDIIRVLAGCNISLDAELAQHVSYLLGHAEQWGLPDNDFVTSHILHCIILPRLHCKGSDMIEPLRAALALNDIPPDLQKTISTLINRAIQYRDQMLHGAVR